MIEMNETKTDAGWYMKTNSADAVYDAAFKDLQSATEWKPREGGGWTVDMHEVKRAAKAFLLACENSRAAYATET